MVPVENGERRLTIHAHKRKEERKDALLEKRELLLRKRTKVKNHLSGYKKSLINIGMYRL